MLPRTTYSFYACTVTCPGPTALLTTTFFDGAQVVALPEPTASYQETARRLGYGENTFSLSQEHELIHTWLMQQLGFPFSPVLWQAAHQGTHSFFSLWGTEQGRAFGEEEDLVLGFQGRMNGLGPALDTRDARLLARARRLFRLCYPSPDG